MKLPRDRLVFLALCVLDDTMAAARKAPVRPTEALRLALAILFALSDGPLFDWPDHRAVFDHFWRVVTGQVGEHLTQAKYGRVTYATTYLHQIERQVRQSNEVARARVKRDRHQAAQAVLDTSAEREQRIDDKRRYYWRPPSKEQTEG